MNAAQRLVGPDSVEVERLTSIYVRARRRGDNVEALGAAARIIAIYEEAGINIPALESYREFVNGGEWRNAT